MNIQTERLENHTARFTVEVEAEQFEKAKRMAAASLAKRVNIPGFRKGKVPYRVLLNYVGEGAILEDAIEVLGNEIYKDALDKSELKPYAPGSLEDFTVDPVPTFTFVVPLQPTVDLGDYRSVRVDYAEPEVKDEDVDRTLQLMQEQRALIEESTQPVAVGNRVTLKLKGVIVPSAEAAEGTTAAEEVVVDRDDMLIDLTSEREPVPGFSGALEGATVDEQRMFDLSYPEDEEKYGDLSGKHVHFDAIVKKVQTRTLPTLNDELAARITENDEKPLTLLELRIKVRDDLLKSAGERIKSDYADSVLDKIIEGASIAYPEAMLEDQIHALLEGFDRDLRQRGMTLADYQKVTGKSHEDLHVDYHEDAEKSVKRSLVLREMVDTEKISVTDEMISTEIDRMVAQFGDQADQFRSLFDTPQMRENMTNNLLTQAVIDRIVAIARGESLPAVVSDEVMSDANVTSSEENA